MSFVTYHNSKITVYMKKSNCLQGGLTISMAVILCDRPWFPRYSSTRGRDLKPNRHLGFFGQKSGTSFFFCMRIILIYPNSDAYSVFPRQHWEVCRGRTPVSAPSCMDQRAECAVCAGYGSGPHQRFSSEDGKVWVKAGCFSQPRLPCRAHHAMTMVPIDPGVASFTSRCSVWRQSRAGCLTPFSIVDGCVQMAQSGGPASG